MTADLALLGRVLEREIAGGCTDTTLDGGLDELLRTQARGERPPSPLLRMVAALPALGYRSLAIAERQHWARRALATVRAAEQQQAARAQRATRTARRAGGGTTGAPASVRARATAEGATPQPQAGGRSAPRTAPPRAEVAREIAPGAAALDLPIARAGTGLRGAALERMERLGLHTVGDALRHFPHRHIDFARTVPIAQLRVGTVQAVRGTIDRAREVRLGRGGRLRSTEATLTDAYGSHIQLLWFNQPYLARALPAGSEIVVAGTVHVYRGRPTFESPEWEAVTAANAHGGRLVPVYPTTQGLAQRTLRAAIERLLERFADRLIDPLPASLRNAHQLIGIVEAVRQLHYPDSEEALQAARRRLAFDELLAVQLGVVSRKRAWEAQGSAPAIDGRATATAFLSTLPYRLTGAQQRVLDDVLRDMARPIPMGRLLEGDVGSGKTVVALAAMLAAVGDGYQASLMAPTEVLAEQHFRTICTLLSGEPHPPLNGLVTLPFLPLPLRVVLLTGNTRAAERREALSAIQHGGAHIVVGTHALIQQGVTFQRLGLAIVDEQHRFGVLQRSALREKGADAALAITPHLLVMTATPIPRSLALTLYGDLDLSVIDEMPPGRTPIETSWLPPERRAEAFAHVRREIEAGRQVFVICPLVEGSDTVQSRAATEEYERLRREEFPDLADRIVLLHGRMPAREKEAVMSAFAAHEADILVSTSVIEVGIDVPNATVMIIEGADRFGLAQLHQFRGRVGRGVHASYCYLLADDPTLEAEERLSTVARTRDGFALAQADLELRGPGELFGTRQSGVPSLRVASLLDARLIEETRREAEQLLDGDPELALPVHRPLREFAARLAADVVSEVH